MTKVTKEEIARLTKGLVDSGKLVEAGWMAFRLSVLNSEATDIKVRDARIAYFCGAQHLFSSIISFLEEGADATDNDMDRMSKLAIELESFVKELEIMVAKVNQ